MKATTLFVALMFALLGLVAACESDDEVVPRGDTSEDELTTAPGGELAVDPGERELTILGVAKGWVEEEQVLPAPGHDVSYTLEFEDTARGVARVVVIGKFQEDGSWLEKQARIGLTWTGGKWIVDGIGEFFLTPKEESRQTELERQAQEEAARRTEFDELTGVLEAYDAITISASVIKVPDSLDPQDGIEDLEFALTIDNPTALSHRVSYTLTWLETPFVPQTPKCESHSRPPFTIDGEWKNSVEVGPQETVEQKEDPLTIYGHQICLDTNVDNIRATIAKIDGYSKQDAQERLEELQTSP